MDGKVAAEHKGARPDPSPNPDEKRSSRTQVVVVAPGRVMDARPFKMDVKNYVTQYKGARGRV